MSFGNGPQFIAFGLAKWRDDLGAETHHIAPGKPWQNGYTESPHVRPRAEWLDRERAQSPERSREVLASSRIHCSTEHLHSSLRSASPAEFWGTEPRPVWLVPAYLTRLR